MSLENVLLDLESMGSIKFGEFKLKSGILSPVYFDLRLMVSDPKLMNNIAQLLMKVNPEAISGTDLLCGVPYTALPLSTLMSVQSGKPMLIRRKEAKSYGTGQMLEGHFAAGQKCLIIEDVITSGSSVLETAELLRGHGLLVDSALVFLDRQQGGSEILASHGIKVHCVTDISMLMDNLFKNGRIVKDVVDKVNQFTANNKASDKDTGNTTSVVGLTYDERLKCTPADSIVSKLFKIMTEKQSNLCVAADLFKMEEIVNLVEKIGSKISCLKIHYDIVQDWTQDSGKQLQVLASKYNFLLIEDRKFFDIGNTVKHQLSSGPGRIASWCDLVTIVTMPGAAILEALKQVQQEQNVQIGALIVAEMSSKDNFFTPEFSKKCVELLNKFPSVAVGLIAQSRLENTRPDVVQMTPGVKRNLTEADGLGQQYISPEDAILNRGADVIIVGRGIIQSEDPEREAEMYRSAGWEAYLQRKQS